MGVKLFGQEELESEKGGWGHKPGKMINDKREQYTHTSVQGTGGVILYSIITLCTGRRVSLTLCRRICLSSVSVPLSLFSRLRRHMHLFYLPRFGLCLLNTSLLTVLPTILTASIALSFKKSITASKHK